MFGKVRALNKNKISKQLRKAVRLKKINSSILKDRLMEASKMNTNLVNSGIIWWQAKKMNRLIGKYILS